MSAPSVAADKSQETPAEWWTGFFHRQAKSLSIDERGARFVTRKDGRKFVLGDPDNPEVLRNSHFSFDFRVSKPGDVFYSPDQHGIDRFDVVRIDPKNLVLHFRSRYDLRGERKESEGEFQLAPFSSK
jgi:hypothetical protein